MKTLINKANPQVRIIAPEIYHDKALGYYVAFDKFDDPVIEEKEEYWTLVEEDTNKREKLKSELFGHKNITYDAYENDSDPYVGVFFEQLADIVESIYENTNK